MSDEIEIAEECLILALGVSKNPVPSKVHIQKELFILSNAIKSIQDVFDFRKHYLGPYSQLLSDIIDSPLYFPRALNIDGKNIKLSTNGHAVFSKLKSKYNKEEFEKLITAFKFVRNLYDKLSERELMFLIYETYPQYTELSKVSDRLLNNKSARKNIISGLYRKGVITKERYEELMK